MTDILPPKNKALGIAIVASLVFVVIAGTGILNPAVKFVGAITQMGVNKVKGLFKVAA